MHLSAVGRDLIGLNRFTLAGIIGGVWLTLGGFLATFGEARDVVADVGLR